MRKKRKKLRARLKGRKAHKLKKHKPKPKVEEEKKPEKEEEKEEIEPKLPNEEEFNNILLEKFKENYSKNQKVLNMLCQYTNIKFDPENMYDCEKQILTRLKIELEACVDLNG